MTVKIVLTKKSKRNIEKLAKAGKIDLRPVLKVIGVGYRKEVDMIFSHQQPRNEGLRWKSLSEKYAKQKRREWGEQDILVRSGSLLASMTTKGASGNITAISKTGATFGSSVSYGIYHDSNKTRKSNLPRRNFSEPSDRRMRIWLDQIERSVVRDFESNGIDVKGSIFA